MSTPDTCVYDLTPPRRPALDDTGGGAKEDDQEEPPNPITDPTANDFNQFSNLHVRHGAVVPVAIVSVHFTTGTPAVFSVATVIGGVVPATFTVTDNGTGDTSLTWAANTFPSPVADPDARATGATMGTATAQSITNGVRVRCSNLANPPAAADINFNVYIY